MFRRWRELILTVGIATLTVVWPTFVLAGGIKASGTIESSSGGFKFPNGTVQTTAFGNNTVGSAQIVDGSVSSSDLGPDSVGSSEIAAAAVGSSELANGSVQGVDVNSSQIQLRVSGSCPAGSSIGQIQSDGGVICEPDDIKGWERVSYSYSCADNSICNVWVGCSSGKRVLGGGLELPSASLGTASFVTMNYSKPRDDKSWEIAATNLTGVSVTYRVWAVCSPAVN